MAKGFEHPFKARCIKTVLLDDDQADFSKVSFLDGEIYLSHDPEVWPDLRNTICLIDHMNEEHYMDRKWFREHFERIES